jgi:hypothetical protein
MEPKFVSVALTSRGSIIQPGDKSMLKVRRRFLTAFRKDLDLKPFQPGFNNSLLINMYATGEEIVPGDSDSGGYPNGYYLKSSLKPALAGKGENLVEHIARHFAGKGIIVSPDERTFIQTFLAPHLQVEITGSVTTESVGIYFPDTLLGKIKGGLLEAIDRCLPKPGGKVI